MSLSTSLFHHYPIFIVGWSIALNRSFKRNFQFSSMLYVSIFFSFLSNTSTSTSLNFWLSTESFSLIPRRCFFSMHQSERSFGREELMSLNGIQWPFDVLTLNCNTHLLINQQRWLHPYSPSLPRFQVNSSLLFHNQPGALPAASSILSTATFTLLLSCLCAIYNIPSYILMLVSQSKKAGGSAISQWTVCTKWLHPHHHCMVPWSTQTASGDFVPPTRDMFMVIKSWHQYQLPRNLPRVKILSLL